MEETLKRGTEEDKERLENAHELVTLATKYDFLPPEEAVARLLEDAALASDQDSLVADTKEERERGAPDDRSRLKGAGVPVCVHYRT